MKVKSAAVRQKAPESKKLSKEDVQKKLEAKFGKKIGAEKKKDEVQISKAAKDKADTKVIDKEDVVIGDIGKNDPKSIETQEKLKALLRTGSFAFSDKERQALSDILKP